MGLKYAGLILLPLFSPVWLDKMHTGEKKKSMSQQVSQSSKRWQCGEYRTFNVFNSVCAPVDRDC